MKKLPVHFSELLSKTSWKEINVAELGYSTWLKFLDSIRDLGFL